MYTIQEILNLTSQYFTTIKLENPRLEAEVLLSDLLGLERIDLYLFFDQPLNKGEVDAFRERVKKRSQGCPTAYITGKKEFLSREFHLTKGVLIPRPETEHLVEGVMDYLKGIEAPLIADIATGSGIIAISLALSLPKAYLYATDLYREALKVAAINIKRYDLTERIQLLEGDLLAPLPRRDFHAILSNPPYIPEKEYRMLAQEVKDFEPPWALRGGSDGLKVIHPLIKGSKLYLKKGGLLALEIGFGQLQQVKGLLMEYSYQLEGVVEDYSGIPRVVLAVV